MSSVTALNLVNRVRLLRRQPTTQNFGTPEDTVTLNALNMAIHDILSTRRWEFNLRHNGQLSLQSRSTDLTTSLSVLSGQSNNIMLLTSTEDLFSSQFKSGQIGRIIPGGDADYGDTGFRCLSYSDVSQYVVGVTIASPLYETAAGTDGTLYWAEYILPDTVQSVVRMRHQEETLEVEQVSPGAEYDELFPRPHIEYGPPRSVAIGGFDVETYDFDAATVPEAGLRVAVWPVPDTRYVLDYSYYYRHPELVNETDLLSGVPEENVNDVILEAASIVKMAWDADYAGAHFSDMAQERASAKYRSGSGSPGQRHRVRSFEGGYSHHGITNGFPGKVIG